MKRFDLATVCMSGQLQVDVVFSGIWQLRGSVGEKDDRFVWIASIECFFEVGAMMSEPVRSDVVVNAGEIEMRERDAFVS